MTVDVVKQIVPRSITHEEWNANVEEIRSALKRYVAREREACAVLAERALGGQLIGSMIAEEIRARTDELS